MKKGKKVEVPRKLKAFSVFSPPSETSEKSFKSLHPLENEQIEMPKNEGEFRKTFQDNS